MIHSGIGIQLPIVNAHSSPGLYLLCYLLSFFLCTLSTCLFFDVGLSGPEGSYVLVIGRRVYGQSQICLLLELESMGPPNIGNPSSPVQSPDGCCFYLTYVKRYADMYIFVLAQFNYYQKSKFESLYISPSLAMIPIIIYSQLVKLFTLYIV